MKFSEVSIPAHASFDLEALRSFVRAEILPASRKSDQDGVYPTAIYDRLHAAGWMQGFIPTELGGLGLSTSDLAHVAREIAYGSPGVYTTLLGNMLGMTPVLIAGDEDLKKRVAQEFLQKPALWSFCMTEPDAGSDVNRLRTRARRVEGGYLVSGQKWLITNATHAQNLLVFAGLEGAPGERRRITAFYIPANSPGVARGQALDKFAHRESNTGELFFDNVFVPDEHRIGAEGEGLRVAFRSLQRSRIMIAAAAVGICDRANDLVLAEMSQRIRYGKPLLAQPTIQSLLAQLHTEALAAWLMTCYSAAIWDSGDTSLKESCMAKLFASDVCVRFVNETFELFGGFGASREFEIEKIYRDAKLLEVFEGPTLVQHAIISKELFSNLLSVAGKQKELAA